MSDRQRFHPLAIAVYLFNGLKSWFFLFILILLNGDWKTTLGKIAIVAIFLFVVIQSVWKYFSETYQILPNKIIVYQGILKKRETDIPYKRIQTIKQRQWFFFRPFNIVQLLIETAGGDGADAEASMTAVDMGLLDQIEMYRQGEQSRDKKLDSKNQIILTDLEADYRVSNRQIILFGLTNSFIAS